MTGEHDHSHHHDHADWPELSSAFSGDYSDEEVWRLATALVGKWRETRKKLEPEATVAWFHCFSGIAGDMALGALIDAGAWEHDVVAMLDLLGIDGWSLETEKVLRSGVAGTKAHVRVHKEQVHHRHARDVLTILLNADLPSEVKFRSLATFVYLAEVEGELHQQHPASVHFHEVGAIDAIIDVVGTAAAMYSLGIDVVTSSPVANGTGTVVAAHGVLPVPVPAVVRLLQSAPTYGLPIQRELTTPTGAAILAANAVMFGDMPAMKVKSTGFGAGSSDGGELPNLTQVVVGTAIRRPGAPAFSESTSTQVETTSAPSATSDARTEVVVVLETNVDDVTGETLGYVIDQLLQHGALDAWCTPIVMKKGRPAHTVNVLAYPQDADRLRQLLVAETGTLGVRQREMTRLIESRRHEVIEIDGVSVRVKVATRADGTEVAKVEHDDAVRLAQIRKQPLRDVIRWVEQNWQF
jgi:uncharacterized protein (TIGR00299 family) protein